MALQVADINAFTQNMLVPELHDLLYQPSPLFRRFHDRNVERYTGGILIQEPAIVGKLWAKAVGKGEEFDISYVVTEAAIVDTMKLYVCNISIFGFDQIANTGPESVFSQIETKMANAAQRIPEVLTTDLYSDNLANPVAVTGLPQWIDDGNTYAVVGGQTRADLVAPGTVGGLNAYTLNLGADFSLPALNKAYTMASLSGTEHPDLVVTSRNGWNLIWQALQPFQRYAPTDSTAVAGFQSFKFNLADVVFDPLIPTGTNGVTYLINSASFKWYFPVNERFRFGFTGFKEMVKSIDYAGQVLVANALLCTNPRVNAKVLSTLF
jgi:hypothetical protein